jgi:hypothetical protein
MNNSVNILETLLQGINESSGSSKTDITGSDLNYVKDYLLVMKEFRGKNIIVLENSTKDIVTVTQSDTLVFNDIVKMYSISLVDKKILYTVTFDSIKK